MKNKTAIVNASPLISLAFIDQLDLLSRIFTRVVVPSEVAREVTKERKRKARELENWIAGKVVASTSKTLIELFSTTIDKGESEVLALYYEMPDAIAIIDEEKARKLASRQNIPHLGTLGVLLLAKKFGYIRLLKPQLDNLCEQGIRISSKLYDYILQEAQENL